MPTKHPESRYVNVFFHESVIAAVDRFRYKHQIPSRNDAIRRMIEYALKNQKAVAAGGKS
jgi:metal-responsive CopG/Arc/MetJ family transcriptional regulator